jgi:antitoxin (DNA-binding transcriptional repressor) of toxin-antitoxin stability system
MKKIFTLLSVGLISLTTIAQSALDFEETIPNYVQLGTSYNGVLTGTNSITVESWVNLESYSFLPTVIGDYGAGDMNFLMRIDGNKPSFHIGTGGVFTNIQATTIIPLATWTHIAGVWDGTDIKIYVNGVLENTIAKGGVFDVSTYPVRIGASLTSEAMDGKLDNVRVWSSARTDAEISTNMNACLTGLEAGLIALYDFEAGTGTVLNDITGNGYDGNFVNSPTWVTGFGCTGGTECANATDLAPMDICGDTQNVTGSTVGGTPQAEPFCGTTAGTGGANWYTFTGDGGDWTVSTVNAATNYDTKLWIFEGACGALNCVTGNDDFSGVQSQVSFTTTLGLTYYVVAGGFSANEGTYDMTISNVETIIPVADVAALADLTSTCSVVMPTAPTATDNCSGSITGTTTTTFPITTQGTTQITWSFQDASGNIATQMQNVIITDTDAPVADVVTLADVTETCEATTLTEPTATDNCSGTVTVTNDATLPITTIGTTIVTWSYEDANGNIATQMQSVIVSDTDAPVADVATLADVTETCEVTTLTEPTATDNCSGNVTVTNDATLPITTIGTTIVTWSYEDANGNIATQMQNVIITDTDAPVADVATLADITETCEVTTLTEPTATDNCSATVTVTNDATLPIATIGTTVVMWTYDDGNGNTSTQVQNVIVLDPMIDITTTTTNFVITANNSAATSYQWIDCTTNSPITGETNPTYTAVANGDYAVVITESNCSDTSDCVTIAGVGINENMHLDVTVYPNPTTGNFYVSTSENDLTIAIYAIDGKLILDNLKVTESNQQISLDQVQPGMYFVKISNENNQKVIRLIIE